jgi:benzylsuccinate CoA-transferase BbsF subunit
LAGFVNLVGWQGKEPISLMVAYTDYLTPHFAAASLVGALDYRRKTGKGQLLDLSQLEVGLQLISPLLLNYIVNGREEKAKGNSCDYAAPHGAYRCKGEDRWCVISVFSDEEWRSFCKAIGEPQWTKETKFSTLKGRKENEEELNRLVEEWTKEHDPYDVMMILQEAGVSAGVVQNGKDLYNDPHLRERECFWALEHKELGRFSHLGQPSILSETRAKLNRPAPCLGEHTEYICREFLGMSEDEFDKYLIEGAFG